MSGTAHPTNANANTTPATTHHSILAGATHTHVPAFA
jgi:hypothetical protein